MARPGDDERRGGGRQPRDSLPTGRWSGPSLAITSSALSRHYGPQRSAGSNAGCAGSLGHEAPGASIDRSNSSVNNPLPGRDRARRISELPHRTSPVRSRTPALWRRKYNLRDRHVVICRVFLSPARRPRRPRKNPSRVPRTYRRYPCNRAPIIRDHIRQKRGGPKPITSINNYESYTYDDIGTG